MTAVLTRLRLTVWRRTPNSLRGPGVALGGALALASVGVGAGLGGAGSGDLLAIVLVAWLIGWILGPLQSGGGDLLRPEWFTLLPLRRRRLSGGLFAASAVGIGPAVTVVALGGLVAYGARLGLGAAVVAVVAVPLTLAFLMVASKVVAEALGAGARSRIATEVVAAQYGLLIAVSMVGWAAFGSLADAAQRTGADVSDLLPGAAATAIRALPSGWGVVAVEAAARGSWAVAAAALVGLAVLVWLALALWTGLLQRRLTGARSGTASRPRRRRRRLLPATPTGAVASKDLRTWVRDPRRGVEVRSALWAAAFSTAALWSLVPDVLPFAGVAVALIGAMACVNVYAMDGTALWLTLLTPGAARADVRGRQAAWLLIFVPATVLPTIVGLLVTGATWAVPWVAALLPALLGGGAGLIPLLSVFALVPETDAHKRSGNPAETGGDATGVYFLMLFSTVLSAAPAAGLLALSAGRAQPGLAWVAVLVGVASGLACAAGFGWLAGRRLEARGPELLQLMRVGRQVETAASSEDTPPRARRAAVGVCVTLGMVALFPQALVPTVMKVTGHVEPVWFLALHAPESMQWPIIAVMTLFGAAMLWVASMLYRDAAPQ